MQHQRVARPLREVWGSALLCVLWASAAGAAEAPAAGTLRDDYAAIVARRDALLAALEARQAADAAKGPAAEVALRLERGADRRDAEVTLRRAGGAWRDAHAAVPGWLPSTMQEWRGFYLANGAGTAWRANLRFPADASALKTTDTALSGALAVTYKLDQTLDQQFPPGEPASWWDRFIPTGHTIDRRQTYTIDAQIHSDAYLLDLVLEGGVNYTPAARKGKKASEPVVRPIFVRLQVPSTRFTACAVATPTWNGGFHEGDATGLQIKDGRITGKLVIMLHQDGWMPWGGKTYQHAPQVVTFDVDGVLANNTLSGSFKAAGDMGNYEGRLSGRGGRAVTGRYRAAGDLGEHTGAVTGMVLDKAQAPRELIRPEPPLPADDAAAARQIAERLNTVMLQVRALGLALQHDALELDAALAQSRGAEPVWTGVDAKALGAYCRRAVAWLPAADGRAPARPAVVPEKYGDSPSAGVAPAAAEGRNMLPAAEARGWHFMPHWRVLGSFEQRPGLEHNAAEVPEVVPVDGVRYVQAVDRFGAAIANPVAQQWQEITLRGPRVTMPGEKSGFFTRFMGEVWYAAAEVSAPSARRVWLSLEANDHAKVYVNGTLVWTAEEKPWRTRSRGRVMVPVELSEGVNTILARVHRDRDPGYLHVALSMHEPEAGAAPASAAFASPYVAPDATPPLVWDLDRGINVAWRAPELRGSTRPVVAGETLVMTSHDGTLHRAATADGKVLWSRAINPFDMIDDAKSAAWEKADVAGRVAMLNAALGLRLKDLDDARTSPPVVWDGAVYVHTFPGVLACFDLDGNIKWLLRTHLLRAQVHVHDGTILVEGEVASSWTYPAELADLATAKGKSAATGVLLVNGSGKEIARYTFRGTFQDGWSTLLTAPGGKRDAAALLTSTGALIDLATGKANPDMDVKWPGPSDDDYQKGGQIIGGRVGRAFGISRNGDTLFMTTQAQSAAVRLWTQPDGRLAFADMWESNYEHGGFPSFYAPSVATDRHVFTFMPVLERGPHCPDSRMELHCHDARTGRTLRILKPALENAVQGSTQLTIAGGYLFALDPGGGSHGGNPTHGQIAIATADEKLQLIARNTIDLGTRVPPVFAGKRMFLRTPKGLVCVAVTTPEGLAYQNQQLATTLLRAVGADPRSASPRRIAPVEVAVTADTPVGVLEDGRATQYWVGGKLPDAAATLVFDSRGMLAAGQAALAPLSRQHAFNDPPLYRREYILQGTGDIVPTFSTRVDPRAVSDDATAGVLQTVLDVPRDCIVIPTLKAGGVRQYLAGQELKADEPLHLSAGLYPLVVRVDPGYYKRQEKEIIPPVAVAKALQAGAIDAIAWPETWQVIGALPPDAAPLEGDDLKRVPEQVTVGEQAYEPHAMKADGGTVYLTGLVDLRPGQKPDPKAPRSIKMATPLAAYAFATVEAPADGTLYVSASGDWYMKWYVDGELVYDTSKKGNGAAGNDVNAHPFAVRVGKGKHTLAVQVQPGNGGWSFSSIAGFSAKADKDLAAHHVPSKQTREVPDFRIAPAFREIPHPPTRLQRWQERVKANEARLRAVIDTLPNTAEANIAAEMLQAVK